MRGYKIGIVVFDKVLTSEVVGLAEVFGIASQQSWFAGSEVILVGVEAQATICTEEGIRIRVDATIADELQLDVLLVPAANDIDELLQHKALNLFIQKQAQQAKWTGSVCAGAFLLANAAVLDGTKATTWFGGESALQAQFPSVVVVYDQPVVVDRRRITANGGVVSYQAALTLLGQLSSPEQAKEVYDILGLARLQGWPDIEKNILQAGVSQSR